MYRIILVATLMALTTACSTPRGGKSDSLGGGGGGKWWKGNTHTHTLWSDGDGAPELVADWYRKHGYNFLVLSDHNILSDGSQDKWFTISDTERSRLTNQRVQEIRARFGSDWVEVRTNDEGVQQMRLKTLPELGTHFGRAGEFIFIQGEEITERFETHPVHVNGLNLTELIPPQGGSSVREVMQRNIDAVIEQGLRLGQPTLAHLNHPNFGWGLTVEDVAAIRGEHFFEVYNGHSDVRNYGGAQHPSTERMWDLALTLRLTVLDLGLLYGMATDDAHDYFSRGVGRANPGRGWVMVQAQQLTPQAIIAALHAGDYYASSGVSLLRVSHDADRFEILINTEENLAYTTRFIGTRKTLAGSGQVGEVLYETPENPAVYAFRGDELYVRAVITSSRLHPNPYAEGDHETAWVQPIIPPIKLDRRAANATRSQ